MLTRCLNHRERFCATPREAFYETEYSIRAIFARARIAHGDLGSRIRCKPGLKLGLYDFDGLEYGFKIRLKSRCSARRLDKRDFIPFGQTVRGVLDVQTLGYEYASTATPIPV